MNAAVPKPANQPERPADAGSRLRSAREAAGLSVVDVSRQLNLGAATITALENGDMEALPPAAFVRGYVRSYAKLLELDVDALLGALNHVGTADPEITPVTGLGSQRASSDPLMRWMSVAVFCVLAVMVVIWWQTKNGDDRAAAPTSTETPQPPVQSQEMLALQREAAAPVQPATTEASGEPETMAAAPQPSVDPQPADTATLTGGEQGAGAKVPEPGSTEPATESPALAPMPEPAPEPDARSVDPGPAAGPAVEPGTVVAVGATGDAPSELAASGEAMNPADSTPGDVAATGTGAEGDELVLMIDGSSWAEVRDAQGRRLFYGMYDSPAPLRLTGQLPFVVFLGNSPAVTVLFQGETHDQSAFNRANNTARFAVDGSGLRTP